MNSRSCLLPIGLVVFSVFAFSSPALAHSPIEGISIFYGYMLHTLVVPAHALLLVATSLLLGQQEIVLTRVGLTVLAAGFVTGLTISAVGLASGSEWQHLLGALAVGGAVSLCWQAPLTVLAPLAAAVGFAIGVDSAPSEAPDDEKTLAFAGLISGTLGLALVVSGLTAGLTRGWQRIGVRIVGSWIVAVALLVLSLTLARDAMVEKSPPYRADGRSAGC